MAPFPLEAMLGKAGAYLVYLVIGFGFGAVLEMAGFANSTKLAAQFYFKDMTVLKVMFGAIVTAMLLVFGAAALGLLEYNRVYVNPTYLWPGIVGGLIMGFGFIIGGFCPGTSIVALATLKWDGLAFALGASAGIFLFGETVSTFEGFWNGSYLGRLTLPQVFGLSTGAVVLLVTLMAVLAFAGAEWAERRFGGRSGPIATAPKLAGAGLVLASALGVLWIGQPTVEDRWNRVAAEREAQLADRLVQIHPGELVDLMNDKRLRLEMYDVREESDYNLFHITDARRTTADELEARAPEILAQPQPVVLVVMSNDEARATEAWKRLVAQDVPNVYILEGGINHWLDVFGHEGHEACTTLPVAGDDELRHIFGAALGARSAAADPGQLPADLDYTPKVKLDRAKAVGGGGCG